VCLECFQQCFLARLGTNSMSISPLDTHLASIIRTEPPLNVFVLAVDPE
jgi:hypothetical protein